jgi:hypothetical protein
MEINLTNSSDEWRSIFLSPLQSVELVLEYHLLMRCANNQIVVTYLLLYMRAK